MTAIPGLVISDEKPNGKTYYEPAVLTVKGQSQYNDDQISFEEIQGFWQLPDQFSGSKRPPQGTVAKFSLSTNPKRGQNARPGSMYMDIGGIYKITEGEQPIAPQQQAQQDFRDDWGDQVADEGVQAVSVEASLTVDEKIKKSQALNLLFDTINAYVPLAEKLESLKDMGFENLEEAKAVAGEQWNNLRNGLTPFMPVDEAAWDNPAEELDQQAQQHLADVANETTTYTNEKPPSDGDFESVPGW